MSHIHPTTAPTNLLSEGFVDLKKGHSVISHTPLPAATSPHVDSVHLSHEVSAAFKTIPNDPFKKDFDQTVETSLKKVLRSAGTATKHFGNIIGGKLGNVIGTKIGKLVTEITGDKALGANVGALTAAASGGVVGGLIGAAIPFLCPYFGALAAGASGGKDTFSALKH